MAKVRLIKRENMTAQQKSGCTQAQPEAESDIPLIRGWVKEYQENKLSQPIKVRANFAALFAQPLPQ